MVIKFKKHTRREIISRTLMFLFLVSLSMFVVSCEKKSVSFDFLSNSTHIEICNGNGCPNSIWQNTIINDSTIVQKTVEFIQKKESGWYEPSFGSPIGKTHIYFYNGEKILEGFSVGPNFLGGGPAGFYINHLENKEYTELMNLINSSGK